ncbi:N-acetylglucosamine-6-phosphate deacetylase [Sneathiella glossodoripedis]|uniref:N-acetylglucosamine-6-phosphate deacetylase n=1 Tax=Sneathiella glossodoripedis TaxID=418853 RepID=UPI000471791C|nr:N-acetylglucosamine-6-phosphate deacetylase [Sneathiella glossodoripedis]
MLAIIPKNILTNGELLSDHYIRIRDGVIDGVIPLNEFKNDCPSIQLESSTVAHGLFDIQVNGGDGVLFNDAPTIKAIERVALAHRRHGTTLFLPTVITDDLKLLREMARAVEMAIRSKSPGIVGIHFEGPFLNPDKKGVHAARYMQQDETQFIGILDEFKLGAVLVTLAPEMVSKNFITELKKRNVKISVGHSAASFEQVQTAHELGATGFTHLYNAMKPITAREPGVIGAALSIEDTYCSLIADGFHLHPWVLKNVLTTLTSDRAILISDAMPASAAQITEFMLNNDRVLVENGRCVTTDGVLAGSAITVSDALNYCVKNLDIPLTDAHKMACSTPARFMGLQDEIGQLRPGDKANLIQIESDGSISPIDLPR